MTDSLHPATYIDDGPMLDSILMDDHAYDPWGVAASWAFAICDLAHVRGTDIPDEWEYSPGSSGPACDGPIDDELAALNLDDDDLITAGYQLIDWLDAIRDAGKDY